MSTLTINPQPGLKEKIQTHMAPFQFGWDRVFRVYNKKYRTNIGWRAKNKKCSRLDIVGQDGGYQELYQICLAEYPYEPEITPRPVQGFIAKIMNDPEDQERTIVTCISGNITKICSTCDRGEGLEFMNENWGEFIDEVRQKAMEQQVEANRGIICQN